jgi:hypothetical protein
MSTLEELRPELREAVVNIMDCFSGADGGASFHQLRLMLGDMDRMAATGDEPAEEIVEMVLRFSRLISAAKKHY